MKRMLGFFVALSMIVSLITCNIKNVDASELSLSNFDFDVYKANLAFKEGNNPVNNGVPPYLNVVKNYHASNHPSGVLINDLDKDDMFEKCIKSFDALTFEPSDELDTSLEESEYDFAILLAMLNISTTDDPVIKAVNSKYESAVKEDIDYINEYLKSVYDVNSKANTQLSSIDKGQTKNALVSLMKEKYKMVENVDKEIEIIDQVFSSLKDIEDITHKITQYIYIYQMTEQTFSVLERMYNQTTDSNLKYALNKIIVCKNDKLSTIANLTKDTGEVVFKTLFKKSVGGMWSSIIEGSPAAPVYLAQQTSKQLCNICFSTDQISEQYYKMKELCEIENLFVKASEDLGKEYIRNKTNFNAKAYNNSVDLYFNLCGVSADYAKEFADIIYKKSSATIFLDKNNYNSFIKTVDSIKSNYETIKKDLSTNYLSYLEEDYPSIYKEYNNKILEEENGGIKSNGKCGDNVEWTLYNNGHLYISGTGEMMFSEAPWYYYHRNDIYSVKIGNGVTNIEAEAFNNCTNLIDVTISNSVKNIEKSAFYGDYSLRVVSIPNSVIEIGNDVFYGCKNLTNIKLPNGIRYLGEYAFAGCSSLDNILIPDSLSKIEKQTFAGCSSLTSVTIPNCVTSIEGAFNGCTSLTSITIPNSVTSIGDCAFQGCKSLTNITIPNSVTSIGIYAFFKCTSLTSIIIPKSVEYIDEDVFEGCENLTLSVYKESYGEKYAKENNLKYKVIDQDVLPTSIKLNATSKTIQKGKTYTLVPTITPTNATNKKVTYTTSNSKVATVISNGTIKAVNYGTAVITVKTSNKKTATCKVTVPYTVKYNLNGGTNNKSNPTSYYGKKITLQNPTRKGYSFAGWYSDSKYKTKVTSFSSGNKVLYAKWNKVTVSKAKTPTLTNIATRKLKVSYGATSGVKGYQIQYATNNKFTGSKTKTTTARSYTLTSLTKGKSYYVRVRGYKTDSTGNKVYGTWSTVKNIKISK